MRSHTNHSFATILMACISLFSLIAFTFDSAAAPFEPVSKPPNHAFSAGPLVPKAGSTQEGTSPMMQMPMVFPLFLQNQDFGSALVLTNAANQSTYADVVLKATNGTEITRHRVEFTAHSQRTVEVLSLLQTAGSSATTGSITVMQSPEFDGTMLILGQLSITNRASEQPNYIDEEVAMPNSEGSPTLRAVADSGEGSPLVAVTNLSEAGQHVTIRCFAQRGEKLSNSVDLLAGETLLTEACSGRTIHSAMVESFSPPEPEVAHGPVGISLTTDGMPGTIAAFGLQSHKKGDHRFFTNITFTDPKMIMSSAIVFDGVPLGPTSLLSPGNYVPELSLTNFSDKNLQVSVQYAESSGKTPQTERLASISIPAGSSEKVTFDDLQGDLELQNSLLISSNGGPGDLLAKLVSKNDSAPDKVELLGKDAQDMNNGGSNPWSVEDGSESTLLLFNHDQAPQIFNVLIASEDGTQWDKDFKLAPMETRAINIADIIQKEVKDDKGKTLPKAAASGQISWWTVGTASGPGAGRLLQSNRASGTARSFACGCPYLLCNVLFVPVYETIGYEGTETTVDYLTPVICLYKTGTHCGGTTTSNSSSQALHYSWTADGTYVQISGSSTNYNVGGYGASLGTGGMTGTVSATYNQPAETCTFQGSGNPAVKIVANLVVPTTTFTTSVASGSGTFNSSVQVGATPANYGNITFTVSVSNPSNPASVNLANGGTGGQWNCQASANGNCAAPSLGFNVSSTSNNTTSGTVTYSISGSSGDPNVTWTTQSKTGTVQFVQ